MNRPARGWRHGISVRRRLLALAVVAIALAPIPARAGWPQAHGESTNGGFVDTVTAPAALPSQKISGLGTFAPGAGPVVAPDGTAYVGNLQGWLHAIGPNGQIAWKRDTPGRTISVSPAIGADGSIYVIGSRTARDHRGGRNVLRIDSTFYRFVPGGGMQVVAPFPEHGGQGSGAAAAPVLWRSGGEEVVMVPVLYRLLGGYELRLLAFSTFGGVLFDQKVTGYGFGPITSSVDWGDAFCSIYPFCVNKIFGLDETIPNPEPNQLPRGVEPPMPGVGISPNPGGAPIVVVADNYENLVGYTFSPAQGFAEIFRKHLTRDEIRMSPPVLLADGHSVIRGSWNDQAWALFGGPHPQNWTEVKIPASGTTPTLTSGGHIVMVDRKGGVTVIATSPTRAVVHSLRLSGESIAPAAASCSHVFVSTADTMVTLDKEAQAIVGTFDWRNGGTSSPAIGSDGRVFALAGDSLHIFPAPHRVGPVVATLSCRRPVLEGGLGAPAGPVMR